jgi:hypothetical protein
MHRYAARAPPMALNEVALAQRLDHHDWEGE